MTNALTLQDFDSGFKLCRHCNQYIWCMPRSDTFSIPHRYWLVWVHSQTEFERCDITKSQTAEPEPVPHELQQQMIAAYNYHRVNQREGQAWMNALAEVTPDLAMAVSRSAADCMYDNAKIPLFREWVFGEKA